MPLPTVEGLERLWDEVASRPLWAPKTFWKYLKLRWRMRLRLMNHEQIKVIAPRFKVNDCTNCTDNCCVGRHSTVLLSFRDIATLIDLDRTELITHQKPMFTAAEQAERPALRRHLSTTSWGAFPVLKQKSLGACAALTNDGRCSLHPHWPSSCARFPYALNTDEPSIFYSRRCNSFWIRPDAGSEVAAMSVAAVASYNQRIKDLVLLEYAPERLESLGLLGYVQRQVSDRDSQPPTAAPAVE